MDRNLWAQISRELLLVALRKESVDRNGSVPRLQRGHGVALRKESVDRNILAAEKCGRAEGRSPQGERG